MRTTEEFILEYAKTHMNPVNSFIHMICVPVIVVMTLGILWGASDWLYGAKLSEPMFLLLNGGTLGALYMAIFYLRLSAKVFAYMAVFLALSWWILYSMHTAGWNVLLISVIVWVAAWAGQFVGHHIEGAKPSFTDDLVFLLIGPVFVLNKALRALGKPLV